MWIWKENLIALKEKSGLSYTQIAQGVAVSESTVKRVFSRKNEDNKRGHSMDLLIAIIHFLGGTVSEIFEDTGAIVGGKSFSELNEKIDALNAENISLKAELDVAHSNIFNYKNEIASLTTENNLLKTQNMYQNKLIETYEHFYKSQNKNE